MKYSEADEQGPAYIEHIDRRWRQLHELEIKRGDAAINYLFLVSGGAAAATLAFIGNAMKDGNPLPGGAIWMLGCFAASLLLVGLMKGRMIHHVVAIYKNWRNEVGLFFCDEREWDQVLKSDEDAVKKKASLVYWLGWASYSFLVAGVVIGFVKLEEGTKHVRQEKPAITATKTTSAEAGRSGECSVGHQAKSEPNRDIAIGTTSAPSQKEIDSRKAE